MQRSRARRHRHHCRGAPDRAVNAQRMDGDAQAVLRWLEGLTVVHGFVAAWFLVFGRRAGALTSLPRRGE